MEGVLLRQPVVADLAIDWYPNRRDVVVLGFTEGSTSREVTLEVPLGEPLDAKTYSLGFGSYGQQTLAASVPAGFTEGHYLKLELGFAA